MPVGSIPKEFLALFIENSVVGWLILLAVGTVIAVAIIASSSIGDLYRYATARHDIAPGRTHTAVPKGAEERPARHVLGDPLGHPLVDAPTEQIPVVDLVELYLQAAFEDLRAQPMPDIDVDDFLKRMSA